MSLRWSIPIGRVLGIRLGIHVTFFLIIAWVSWIGWDYGGFPASLWAVAMICLLFFCVVLHELGHSVVALRFGIEVNSITLLPIGGVAAMQSMPEEPREELLIAIAGPLVNVIILAILIPFVGFPTWLEMPLIPGSVSELVDTLIRANFILVAFNLLPAFPMDGGRVLRACLAMVISYPAATAWASGIGRCVAVLFVLVGLYVNPFLAIIGVFVFLGAEGENRMVRVKDAVKNIPVSSLMRRNPPVLQTTDTLRDCLQAYHHRGVTHFIVLHGARLRGILPASVWMEAVKMNTPDERVEKHMLLRFFSFSPDLTLDQVIQDILGMKQDLFPVVEGEELKGALVLDDLRDFIARKTGAPSSRPPQLPASAEPPSRSSRFNVDLG